MTAAVVVVLFLVAVAVAAVALSGSGDDEPEATPTTPSTAAPTTTTTTTEPQVDPDVPLPSRGGSVTYGLANDNPDGWCLPEVQLDRSGATVARAVYDTLTAPAADGRYVPYLAQAVEPDGDMTTWTITLRAGVEFHDGTPLTAEVVKDNLDAYRGEDPDRPDVYVFAQALSEVRSVEVTGDLEVTVTTAVPWPALPATLHSGGRMGILGQAQLASESCHEEPVGTGPFRFVDGELDQQLTVEANPRYWQTAPDGEPYPYLDEITFVPVAEGQPRAEGVLDGELDLAQLTEGSPLLGLLDRAESGDAGLTVYEPPTGVEVTFLRLNTSAPPFDDEDVRRAVSLAIDRKTYSDLVATLVTGPANGPFPPGTPGYDEDAGGDVHDPAEAEELVTAYEADNGPIRVTYQTTPGVANQANALLIQEMLTDVGIEVEVETATADRLFDDAISGSFDVQVGRLDVSGDPDEVAEAFRSGSIVNFGRIDDPAVDDLLDEIRAETDPDARAALHRELGAALVAGAWSPWLAWSTPWIASNSAVQGYDDLSLPLLPDDSDPSPTLVSGHPVHGLWIADGGGTADQV